MGRPGPRALALIGAFVMMLDGAGHAGVVLDQGGRKSMVDVQLQVGPSARWLTWHTVGAALRARIRTRSHAGQVVLAPLADGSIEVRADIRYLRASRVSREALLLSLPGPALAIDRALGFGPVRGSARVDRGTPGQALVGDVLVIPEDGVAATEVRARNGGAAVRLIGYDYGSHPRRIATRCGPGRLPNPWRKVRTVIRRRGELVTLRARLFGRRSRTRFSPLIIERWRAGASAAVVFTDHADRTDPEALRAVLYGTSNTSGARYGKGGFVGHGLKLTKTFFVFDRAGGIGSDREASKLADELVARGSEVGLHSIVPHAETRQMVRRGLLAARRWKPVTWIDHQPHSNCEALSNRGASRDRRWNITDLLVKSNIRWVWASTEATFRPIELNLFQPTRSARAEPAIFPLTSDPRLWIFRSNWFYGPPQLLGSALSARNIERLERERGLLVAHTYLSTSGRRSPAKYASTQLTLRNGNWLELHPEVDAALARLGARVRGGTLTSLTWREAGERLQQVAAVRVRYLPGGSIDVTNAGGRMLKQLAVSVLDRQLELRVAGRPVPGRISEGRRTVWFDLAAGATVRVQAFHGGRPVPLLASERLRPALQ